MICSACGNNVEYFRACRCPPIIVTGCGHSGTTIVATLLGAHPSCALIRRETFFLSHLDRAAVAKFWEYARDLRATRWVEKTPAHVNFLHALNIANAASGMRDVVPDYRLVLVARDGRDVVSSLMRRGKTFQAALARWNKDTSAAVTHDLTDPKSILVRYEDLVAHPVVWVGRMLTHAGLPLDPQVFAHHQQPQRWQGAVVHPSAAEPSERRQHVLRRAWQISQPLFDGRGRWRSNPDFCAQLDAFWARSKALMGKLRYQDEVRH